MAIRELVFDPHAYMIDAGGDLEAATKLAHANFVALVADLRAYHPGRLLRSGKRPVDGRTVYYIWAVR